MEDALFLRRVLDCRARALLGRCDERHEREALGHGGEDGDDRRRGDRGSGAEPSTAQGAETAALLFCEQPCVQTLGEILLTPTQIYAKDCLALIAECDVHAFAHITGG